MSSMVFHCFWVNTPYLLTTPSIRVDLGYHSRNAALPRWGGGRVVGPDDHQVLGCFLVLYGVFCIKNEIQTIETLGQVI